MARSMLGTEQQHKQHVKGRDLPSVAKTDIRASLHTRNINLITWASAEDVILLSSTAPIERTSTARTTTTQVKLD